MFRIEYTQQYNKPLVLALGFFDCMHVGHMQLINNAKKLASDNAEVAIMTFCNNHFAQLGKDTKLLYSYQERLDIYQHCGVDVVVEAVFDRQFMALTGDMNLDALTNNKNIVGIVCGYDHRSGSDMKDHTHIQQYCKDKNIPCVVVDQISNDSGVKISSSLIRQLVAEHNFDTINNLLSEPYHISGTVNSGRGVGHRLGFATANVSVSADKLLPTGVFVGKVQLCDNSVYTAIVNIGRAPTFSVESVNVEAHLLGYSGDLYGQFVKVYITRYLREIVCFDTKEQLISQLEHDCQEAMR